ncbi:hypothetical protein PsAD13_01467 [Pseudovibrio sp. Ad13]|nr:hypothetical protein PsAD13_01467 [Pseudovibrio sp. Ad13]KZK95281.1 hypothetical protein PsW74_04065 [Pseudovibrio sp. W74]KZL07263.1 hypothetical protein PsAD14_03646 [Pseudovibrio sp. Ad14]
MRGRGFQVRDVLLEDAADITFVLRESTSQLRDADHNNDPCKASNKTTATALPFYK